MPDIETFVVLLSIFTSLSNDWANLFPMGVTGLKAQMDREKLDGILCTYGINGIRVFVFRAFSGLCVWSDTCNISKNLPLRDKV